MKLRFWYVTSITALPAGTAYGKMHRSIWHLSMRAVVVSVSSQTNLITSRVTRLKQSEESWKIFTKYFCSAACLPGLLASDDSQR
jgi:hypothetical protein